MLILQAWTSDLLSYAQNIILCDFASICILKQQQL